MEKIKCSECGKPIPQERLKILPETTTCVKCSKVESLKGFPVWDGTTSDLVIVSDTQAKQLQRYERNDGRLGRLK